MTLDTTIAGLVNVTANPSSNRFLRSPATPGRQTQVAYPSHDHLGTAKCPLLGGYGTVHHVTNLDDTTAGTDPSVPDNNGDLDGDGYTNLENYLHHLAAGG